MCASSTRPLTSRHLLSHEPTVHPSTAPLSYRTRIIGLSLYYYYHALTRCSVTYTRTQDSVTSSRFLAWPRPEARIAQHIISGASGVAKPSNRNRLYTQDTQCSIRDNNPTYLETLKLIFLHKPFCAKFHRSSDLCSIRKAFHCFLEGLSI